MGRQNSEFGMHERTDRVKQQSLYYSDCVRCQPTSSPGFFTILFFVVPSLSVVPPSASELTNMYPLAAVAEAIGDTSAEGISFGS